MAEDRGGEPSPPEALVPARGSSMLRAILAASVAMVAPPVIAALVSGLALAVVVGMVSIVTGLVGMSLVIYQQEKWHRRAGPAELPRARLLPRP